MLQAPPTLATRPQLAGVSDLSPTSVDVEGTAEAVLARDTTFPAAPTNDAGPTAGDDAALLTSSSLPEPAAPATERTFQDDAGPTVPPEQPASSADQPSTPLQEALHGAGSDDPAAAAA